MGCITAQLVNNKEKYLYLCIVVLLITMLFPISATRAQHQAFRNFSTELGLPQSQVLSIYQDQRGFIWTGTMGGGVVRFDGHSFVSPDTAEEQPFKIVNAITEDTQGTLWFGTEMGLYAYDGFELTAHNGGQDVSKISVNCLFVDHQGQLWVGTSKGLYVISDPTSGLSGALHILADEWITALQESKTGALWIGTTSGFYTYTDSTFSAKKELPETEILSMSVDDKNTLWVGSNSGVYAVQNETVTRYTPSGGLSPDLFTSSVYVDSKNTVWAGTSNGIFRFNGQKFVRYATGAFDDDFILSILEDKEGNYWFGVGGKGIFVDKQHAFTYLHEDDGLSDNIVWSVKEIKPNTFWIGTKRGLVLFEPPNKIEALYPETFNGKNITDIHVDQKGRIWIATLNGVYLRQRDQFKFISDWPGMPAIVFNIDETKNNLWFHTNAGLIKYTGEEATLFDIKTLGELPQAITEDKHGDHWIGTRNGLLRLRGNTLSSFSEADSLTHNSVLDIATDLHGNVWIATYGGLAHIEISEDKQATLLPIKKNTSRKQIDTVWFLDIDKNNMLWFCDQNKLSRLDVNTFKKGGSLDIQVFDQIDGYYEKECITRSLTFDRKEDLWFGTVSGVVKYTQQPLSVRRYEVPTVIDKIEVDYVSVNEPAKSDNIRRWSNLPDILYTKYGDGPITFYFKGLHFRSPRNVSYRYWLEGNGLEKKTLSQPSVTFEKLWPGTYTLHAEAVLQKGDYAINTVSYTFVVKPAYWQTWYFFFSLILLKFALIVAVIRWRTYKVKQQKRALAQLVAARTAELKSAKNHIEKQAAALEQSLAEKNVLLKEIHHRVRNNLQVISGLLYLQSNRIEDEKILALFRQSEARIEAIAAVHEKLYTGGSAENVKIDGYLSDLVHSIATGNRADERNITLCLDSEAISVKADIATSIGLIVNELVSNVFKHAFVESPPPIKPLMVRVSFKKQKNNYCLRVSDNGKGLDKAQNFENSNSLGIKIIQAFCDKLNASFSFDSHEGTVSTVIFPKEVLLEQANLTD